MRVPLPRTRPTAALRDPQLRPRAELDALHEMAILVAERLDTSRLLTVILERATELVGVEDGYLYLVDGDGLLTVRAGTGIFRQNVGFHLPAGAGVAGRVVTTGEPVAVDDYRRWDGRARELDPAPLHAVVGVPLRGGEGVIGVIGMARTSSGVTFGAEEVALLERFGRLAAIAIDNARLHESAHAELAERRRTEEELLDTVARLSRSELELRAAQAETIRRLADAAEFRDAETGRHTERMSRMCWQVARRLGIDEERCDLIRDASPLHDIGKIAIPDEVLLKPGAFTDEQRATMERHPEIGYALLSGSHSEVLDLAATIALTHHERWDGKGYPRGLAGEAIPLEGRIAAVADVFDALTADRVYRPALSVEESLRMMRDERGTRFDPLVLDALLAVVQEAQEHETVEQMLAPAEHDPVADAVVEEVQTGAGPGRRRRISDRELRKACRAAERALGPARGRDAVETALAALCTPFEGRLLASVYAVEHDRLWLVGQHGYVEVRDGFSLEHGVMGRAARTGTIQVIADVGHDQDFIAATGGIVSEAAAPFQQDGRVVAVLNIESVGVPLPASAGATIAPLASLVGARVADVREGFGSDVGELVRLCVQASSLRGIGAIAELATRTVGRILGLASAQLDLWREADERPRLVSYWRRDDAHLEPLPAELLRVLEGTADAATTASVVSTAQLRIDDAADALVVLPLRAGGEMVGMISGRVVAGPPAQERLEAATLFAQHTAALIDVATALRREQRAAVTDQLTGLLNRRGFEDRFQVELQRASRDEIPVAVILCDCDGLKTVNDMRGHEMGDALLELVASCLRTHKRTTDIAARFGGDEFAILLPDADMETALAVAERIRSAISAETIGGFRPSASFGAAGFPLHGRTTLEVLKAADEALYRAKQRGGDEIAMLQG